MCGRTRQTLGEEQVLHAAGARRWVDRQQYQPSYNAAPGFPAPVVRAEGDETVVHTMRCGCAVLCCAALCGAVVRCTWALLQWC